MPAEISPQLDKGAIMGYDTSTVTNALLQRGFKESRTDMTPMKLQKLLYFLNGWHLAITGNPAVPDPFRAWKFGPVVQPVYHALKHFGASPVTEYLKSYDYQTRKPVSYVPSDSDAAFSEILDVTWEKYIGISAVRLSAMTHEPGSPWDITMQRLQAGQSDVIPDALIRDYFIGIARPTRKTNSARTEAVTDFG